VHEQFVARAPRRNGARELERGERIPYLEARRRSARRGRRVRVLRAARATLESVAPAPSDESCHAPWRDRAPRRKIRAMEALSPAKMQAQLQRSLASLKLVSRLLSHELHAQSSSKTVSLSRDEVVEIQTVVDLFIEEASRRPNATPTLDAVNLVATRAVN